MNAKDSSVSGSSAEAGLHSSVATMMVPKVLRRERRDAVDRAMDVRGACERRAFVVISICISNERRSLSYRGTVLLFCAHRYARCIDARRAPTIARRVRRVEHSLLSSVYERMRNADRVIDISLGRMLGAKP